uniref:Secretory carrier-associated membrane protein n=1 Tax=Oryza glumipatula TaxID=40148 RepID=A0A0E0A1A6_9ORYZ
MAGKHGRNGFEDDDVNPFAGGSVLPANNSRLPPLSHEPADFYNVDIPLDSSKDLKKKEKELQAMEAELNKRERELKRKEEAAAQAGIVIEDKNWPPFFPLIHHNISNEIPIHLQRMQYLAFSSIGSLPILEYHSNHNCMGKRGSGILPAIDVIGKSAIVGIFYFVGFGLFCLESLLSIGVIQQVYMYFRGSGKAAEMKREAARAYAMNTSRVRGWRVSLG